VKEGGGVKAGSGGSEKKFMVIRLRWKVGYDRATSLLFRNFCAEKLL